MEEALPEVDRHWGGSPTLTEESFLVWDGEWQITKDVFRDLGIAFAAVLLLLGVRTLSEDSYREHLTAILDNAALHATPLYRMALDRREAMETTFTQVVFAPALPPEEQPEGQSDRADTMQPHRGCTTLSWQ